MREVLLLAAILAGPPTPTIHSIGADNPSPKAVTTPMPRYAASPGDFTESVAVAEAIIAADGRVEDAAMIRGAEPLHAPVLKAVRGWRFERPRKSPTRVYVGFAFDHVAHTVTRAMVPPLEVARGPRVGRGPDDSPAGLSGPVLLRVWVGLDGHVQDAEVLSGDEALRPYAVRMVNRYVYEPPLKAPVELVTSVVVGGKTGDRD